MPNSGFQEISVAEAARQLGVGLQYAYALIYSGRLAARRVNGRWLVPLAAVRERKRRLEGRHGGH